MKSRFKKFISIGVFPVLSLFLLFSFTSCTTNTQGSVGKREAFDNWLYQALATGDINTESDIKALGSIQDVSSVPYRAAHAEGEWKVTTYQFDGLNVVAIVQQMEPRRALVGAIKITSPDWPLSNGLAVGAPMSEIDLPVRRKVGSQQYCGINNCIEFEEEQGRISSITMMLYAE